MVTVKEAKNALDRIIEKSRVHLYKPIQIAEILYRARIDDSLNLLDLEQYRTKSKKWRDEISLPLLGRICTSSAKFQDNLFDANAIPPEILNVLGKENIRTNGAVEAYIYRLFSTKHNQLSNALKYCTENTPENFDVKKFIDSFWNEPGLRRSLDKIYEIIVYSLFSMIVETLNFQITLSVDSDKIDILKEFEDFADKVMQVDLKNKTFVQEAKIYRVGVTNASDRGLDMYSNWGPAIQIKHLSLNLELAESIVSNISSDKVVIVCKDAEKDIILSLLSQIGWCSHIQSIITEDNLIDWYEKALRGKYSEKMKDKLLDILINEISEEFPSIKELPDVLKERHYELIDDSFWK